MIKFNDGDISNLKIPEDLDISPRLVSCKAQKSLNNVKSRRKSLRHIRKNFLDNTEDKKEVTYEAGSF